MRSVRVEATRDVYGSLYGQSSRCTYSAAVIPIKPSMSFWNSLDTVPLRQIDAEIASLEKLPMGDRAVSDTDRLADLRRARRRITGSRRGDF